MFLFFQNLYKKTAKMMNIPELKTTYDYGKFKLLRFNRQINHKKVCLLMDEIRKENCLRMHPIIVNSRMEVVDGQHRLEAARRLRTAIYYMEVNDVSTKHVMNANVHQTQWKIKDIVRFYHSKDGLLDYKKVLDFCRSLDLSVSALLKLCFGGLVIQKISSIKRGDFFFPKEAQSMDKIDSIISLYKKIDHFIKERKIEPIRMIKTSNFTRSLHRMAINQKFNEKRFLDNLEVRWHILKPCYSEDEWFEVLLKIFNYRATSKLNKKIIADFEEENNDESRMELPFMQKLPKREFYDFSSKSKRGLTKMRRQIGVI